MTGNTARLFAILTAILAVAALRLVPHPPNFTPIGAMALFSGSQIGRKPLAFAAPLGAMLLSDAFIGFHGLMPFTYGSMALIVLLGWLALKRVSVLRVASAAIVGSVLFYLITNFGVWLQLGTYPHTAAGLVACYVAAIPFFQNTVAGDLFYATLLFCGFRIVELLVPRLEETGAQTA